MSEESNGEVGVDIEPVGESKWKEVAKQNIEAARKWEKRSKLLVEERIERSKVKIPKYITLDYKTGEILVDGEPFPYYVTPDGVSFSYQRTADIQEVTFTIYADNVGVVGEINE